MRRSLALVAFCIGSITAAPSAFAQSETLVLPFRSIGVSDTTVAVVGDLLNGELESRGIAVIPSSRLGNALPHGDTACDDRECAAAAAAAAGASRVVYGSLSRLGDKVIVRVRALWIGDTTPDYADQLTATTEEDLDTVVRRIAETLAAGRPDAAKPSVETVTREETFEPRRRSSNARFGIRAGFLFPVDNSYGDADRLTSLGLVITYETPTFFVQSTPLVGIAWRGDTVEWTPFDLFFARIFGLGDFAPYVGAGLGVSALHVERKDYAYYSPYESSGSTQSETTLVGDLGVGLLAMRTYDFAIVLDLRYHYVFADFDEIGGKGAHGIALRFGIGR